MNELSLFTNAFHHAAIGMALVGTDGNWIKVNRSLCHIVGYSKEELLKKSFQSITHPEDLDVDLNYLRQMLNGEIEYYQMEKRYFHKKGNVVWVLLSVSCVCDQEKRPLYFISQIQDITARKEAEEIQKRLNAILEATTDFVATADTNGRVLYYNASARKMLGIDENQDISTITIPDTHPEWAGKLIRNEALPTAALKGVWNGETALLSLDGREIQVF
ncbi:PAS domain S-box protein [Bacillaceae bacterium IKA-2]|nr:PAS domain S-box protein [Bacillaceae bacterium IKA-2]